MTAKRVVLTKYPKAYAKYACLSLRFVIVADHGGAKLSGYRLRERDAWRSAATLLVSSAKRKPVRKPKRAAPTLRPLWISVMCCSQPDGYISLRPQWKDSPPGLLTRLAAANRLEALLNAYLKRRKLP